MSSTSDVLAHHLESFGAGDIDAMLADYAADAVMFTPDGPLMGPDAIRPVLAAMLVEFGQPGMSFEMTTQSVEGDVAYIVWKAETADNVYEMGTDTFVVRSGKIVAQSFAAKTTAKR
ncbi:MAG TPA: nuclear transport factor 2 family protein [Gemmatimonadales bacterium]|jgi:ketosteroid isomerase-like protein